MDTMKPKDLRFDRCNISCKTLYLLNPVTLNGDRDINQHKFHFYFILFWLLISDKIEFFNKDRFFQIAPRRFIEFDESDLEVSESVDAGKGGSERHQQPFS